MNRPAAAGPAPSFARRVDDAVFEVERVFVTVAALIMTATVTLDIVYRGFHSPESKIAEKIGKLIGWVWAPPGPDTLALLTDWVSPAVLLALTFCAGWTVYASGRRRDGLPASRSRGALWGGVAVGLAYTFIQFVLRVPSRWVCMTLLLGGCATFLVYALRRGQQRAAIVTACLSGLLAWGCTYLRKDYIWSQELSLILLAWVAFLGGSMATRAHRHITVDALAKIVPGRLRPWTRAIGLLLTTAFCAYVALVAWRYIFGPRGALEMAETRPATGIPAWTISLAVLVSFVLMSLRFGAATVEAFLRPRASEPGGPH